MWINKTDMKKRIFRVLAVIGLLAVVCACGLVRMVRETISVSAGAADAYPSTGAAGEAGEEPGENASGASAWTGRTPENSASGEDFLWIGPVRLPGRPQNRTPIPQEELPVMGTCYSAEKPYLIGLDPGHLGYTADKYFNSGAMSVWGTMEYEWTMEISQLLSDELTARGYDVYLLRATNNQKEYPYNNGQRAQAANSMECDILVAIHWDSNENEETVGYHAIYKGDKSSAAYRLAKAVSDAYGAAVDGHLEKYVNPMSRKDLWELNVARMPAIILECGFSSNREEAAWLENEKNYGIIVQGIADGIDDYFAGERVRGR